MLCFALRCFASLRIKEVDKSLCQKAAEKESTGAQALCCDHEIFRRRGCESTSHYSRVIISTHAQHASIPSEQFFIFGLEIHFGHFLFVHI